MRASSGVYRLTFMLPASLQLRVALGRHSPCLHGCVVSVEPVGLVSIEGPSRERVFDQATRFFRIHAKGLPALTVSSSLQSPAKYCPAGRDTWKIVIGAEISFACTPLDPEIAKPEVERPQITVLNAG